MENLKTLTLGRFNMHTNGDGPANYPLFWNYAQRGEWKFAEIRGYI